MTLAQAPTTETGTGAEAAARFEELLAFAAGGRDRRVVIARDGQPIAAIVSFADLERFDLLLLQRRRRFAILEQLSQKFADISDEVLEREIDRAVAEVCVERQTRHPKPTAAHG
jgi:hypothetical protein